MKYAQIRSFDISNGSGIGVSLFVQGCPFHCVNCFNPETWDFNGGKEWTEEIESQFMELINRPYIKRVSFLGGSPLAHNNVNTIYSIIKKIRKRFLDKKIWVYTGYTFEQIMSPTDSPTFRTDTVAEIETRKQLLKYIDVLVDGPYIQELRDLTLKFKGSSNQRLIDVKKTLENQEVVLL